MRTITVRTPEREYVIPEGKPCIIKWKAKNKERKGISTGIGWIKRGEKLHTILLVHSAFQTWDGVEAEYVSKWTIWESQIIEITKLAGVK